MKNCYELLSHFHTFYVEIHNQFHIYVQSLRSDNAKEYVSEQFQSFMLQNIILHQTSNVDTPSQNGVAKRKNRHLLETTKALLFQMRCPSIYGLKLFPPLVFLLIGCLPRS